MCTLIQMYAPINLTHRALQIRYYVITREKFEPGINNSHPVLYLFPPFSLPDVLCDPTDIIWRKGNPFEELTVRTAPSSDGLLAEGFWGFPQL